MASPFSRAQLGQGIATSGAQQLVGLLASQNGCLAVVPQEDQSNDRITGQEQPKADQIGHREYPEDNGQKQVANEA